MNYPSHIRGTALAAVSFLFGVTAFAGDITNCDKVAADVRAAVAADPAKVLLVVEDAMVANETCACEIVKAAIYASKAQPDLIKQIVLTATNVAPNMSSIISDCSSLHSEGDSSKEVLGSEKQAFQVQPVSPVQPQGDTEDYIAPPMSIRGVYLTQPAAGGGYVDPERPSCACPISPSCAVSL